VPPPFERPQGGSDPRRALAPCPELDCIRHRLPPGALAAAEQRALALGVGADRVLIAARAITEDAYVVALAAALRLAYEPLDDVPREACPLPDERLTDADTTGLLPLRVGGDLVWVVAPRALAARRLIALIGAHPGLAARIRLTSARNLRRFVIRHGGRSLAHRAAEALRLRWPELSAASSRWRHTLSWLGALAALAAAATVFPLATMRIASAGLASIFLAWSGLRVLGAITGWDRWRPSRLQAGELPIYTLMVPLYDEAAAVDGLIAALRRIDYPALGSKLT
jgi:hypothetical protein